VVPVLRSVSPLPLRARTRAATLLIFVLSLGSLAVVLLFVRSCSLSENNA
jgi:hypothetical protein